MQQAHKRQDPYKVLCPICNWKAFNGSDIVGGNMWREMSFHLLQHLNIVRPRQIKRLQFRERRTK